MSTLMTLVRGLDAVLRWFAYITLAMIASKLVAPFFGVAISIGVMCDIYLFVRATTVAK
ncbi:MAG: hypothetical protein JO051_10805 [Acidobacteriaceae bacterium]|nr:hypothetical protein [Acidobacteriaceae bacterium]